MLFWTTIKVSCKSLMANKLRSFLAMLGIIIGVMSVIAVVSIVQGLSHTVNKQFEGLGSNSLTVQSYTRVAALMAPLDEVRARTANLQKRRDILFEELSQVPELSCARPEGAIT